MKRPIVSDERLIQIVWHEIPSGWQSDGVKITNILERELGFILSDGYVTSRLAKLVKKGILDKSTTRPLHQNYSHTRYYINEKWREKEVQKLMKELEAT